MKVFACLPQQVCAHTLYAYELCIMFGSSKRTTNSFNASVFIHSPSLSHIIMSQYKSAWLEQCAPIKHKGTHTYHIPLEAEKQSSFFCFCCSVHTNTSNGEHASFVETQLIANICAKNSAKLWFSFDILLYDALWHSRGRHEFFFLISCPKVYAHTSEIIHWHLHTHSNRLLQRNRKVNDIGSCVGILAPMRLRVMCIRLHKWKVKINKTDEIRNVFSHHFCRHRRGERGKKRRGNFQFFCVKICELEECNNYIFMCQNGKIEPH